MMTWGQVKAVQKVFGCLFKFKFIFIAAVHSLPCKAKMELQKDGLHKEYPFSGPHIHVSCQCSDV